MQFQFTEEQDNFRRRVSDFLTKELTPEVVAENWDPLEWSGWSNDFVKVFLKKLADRGFIGISWPEKYGGHGKDVFYEVILREELDYHGAPSGGSATFFIPHALLRFGSEEQKKFFLPKIRNAETSFFLGYSEPEAGSDLASLQTRAVADGDFFVINGQKTFSSSVHHSDYGWVAARTDPSVPKHKGISVFIVDMKTPGITMTPSVTMSGWNHFDTFFEDVRVPRANLVGELNRGWRIIMGAIDWERAVIGNAGTALANFDRLLAYCKRTERNGRPLSKDPIIRHKLADLAIDVEATRLMCYWLASMYAKGLLPEHEASLLPLFKREIVRRIDYAGVEILGLYAQLKCGCKRAPLNGAVERDYTDQTYLHFAAGGFDITRNVVAIRGLGLPT